MSKIELYHINKKPYQFMKLVLNSLQKNQYTVRIRLSAIIQKYQVFGNFSVP